MKERKIPQHIAIIMDGNGRWAKRRGLPRTAGHKQGAQNIRKIAIECNRLGIKALTLYAFSTENWKRPDDEVDYLCKLPKFFFNSYLKELNKNNIRITFLGELSKFPKETQEIVNTAVSQTSMNTGLTLCFAINYGSRREIVLAAQRYADDVLKGVVKNELTEDMFGQYFMTHDMPEVELMIRTSGELRLSNFLLWQLAYAEFIFTEVAWPDFTEEQLDLAITEFALRNRRFGGIEDEN